MTILRLSYLEKQATVTRTLVAQDVGEAVFNKEFLDSLIAGREKSESIVMKFGFFVIVCVGLLFFYVQDYKLPVTIFGLDLSSVVGYGELVLLLSSLGFALFCSYLGELSIRHSTLLGYVQGDLLRKQATTKAALILRSVPYDVLGQFVYNDPSDEFFRLTRHSRISIFSVTMILVVMIAFLISFLCINFYSMVYILIHPTLGPALAWIIAIVSALCEVGGVLSIVYLSMKQAYEPLMAAPVATPAATAGGPAGPTAGKPV
jgi:hypothetical protein